MGIGGSTQGVLVYSGNSPDVPTKHTRTGSVACNRWWSFRKAGPGPSLTK